MTTMKTFLVTASCGLVLLGAVAAQAIGLGSVKEPRGPNCFESPEVRIMVPCPPPDDPEDPQAHTDWRELLSHEYRSR